MAQKLKWFHYIVDGMDARKAVMIKKALLGAVPQIINVHVNLFESKVSVYSIKPFEKQVKMAAEVADASFRTKLK